MDRRASPNSNGRSGDHLKGRPLDPISEKLRPLNAFSAQIIIITSLFKAHIANMRIIIIIIIIITIIIIIIIVIINLNFWAKQAPLLF